MPDRHENTDPTTPDRNPLGLGSRGRESSNTGSTEDTSYDAHGSDPYTTGEPEKRFDDVASKRSVRADPDVPSSDEP